MNTPLRDVIAEEVTFILESAILSGLMDAAVLERARMIDTGTCRRSARVNRRPRPPRQGWN